MRLLNTYRFALLLLLVLSAFKSVATTSPADTLTRIERILPEEKKLLTKLIKYHKEMVISDSVRRYFSREYSYQDESMITRYVSSELILHNTTPMVTVNGQETDMTNYNLMFIGGNGMEDGLKVIFSYSLGRVLSVDGTALITDSDITSIIYSCGASGNCNTYISINGVETKKPSTAAKPTIPVKHTPVAKHK